MSEFRITREREIHMGKIPKGSTIVRFEIRPTQNLIRVLRAKHPEVTGILIPREHASSAGKGLLKAAREHDLDVHIEGQISDQEKHIADRFEHYRKIASSLGEPYKSHLDGAIELFEAHAREPEKILLSAAFRLGRTTEQEEGKISRTESRKRDLLFAVNAIDFAGRIDLRKVFNDAVKQGRRQAVSSNAFSILFSKVPFSDRLASGYDGEYVLHPVYFRTNVGLTGFFDKNGLGNKSHLKIVQQQGVEGFSLFASGVVSKAMERHRANFTWRAVAYNIMEILAATAGRPIIMSLGSHAIAQRGVLKPRIARGVYDYPSRLKWKGVPSGHPSYPYKSWGQLVDQAKLLEKFGRKLPQN